MGHGGHLAGYSHRHTYNRLGMDAETRDDWRKNNLSLVDAEEFQNIGFGAKVSLEAYKDGIDLRQEFNNDIENAEKLKDRINAGEPARTVFKPKSTESKSHPRGSEKWADNWVRDRIKKTKLTKKDIESVQVLARGMKDEDLKKACSRADKLAQNKGKAGTLARQLRDTLKREETRRY
jgi:hypothetical protein